MDILEAYDAIVTYDEVERELAKYDLPMSEFVAIHEFSDEYLGETVLDFLGY